MNELGTMFRHPEGSVFETTRYSTVRACWFCKRYTKGYVTRKHEYRITQDEHGRFWYKTKQVTLMSESEAAAFLFEWELAKL